VPITGVHGRKPPVRHPAELALPDPEQSPLRRLDEEPTTVDGTMKLSRDGRLSKFIAPRTSLLGPDVHRLALTGQIIIQPLPAMETEFDVIKAELAVHE
jgi:hypothetical protein